MSNNDKLVTHNKHGQRLGYYDFMLENSRKAALQDKVNTAEKLIWVTFKKEGIHKYPAAIDDPKLATGGWDDVSFLGYPHRHIFHFRVCIEVFDNDRDIEFIQFKRWLERLYNGDGSSETDMSVLELDYKSCEMIADVSEDGENGCSLTFNK
jgi:hypothetical protein